MFTNPYIGFDRVNHSKSISIITENHHAGETFMLAPLLFSLGPQWPPQFFHSRIATGPILNSSAVKLQNLINEQGATSVESLKKRATNHERLRSTDLYLR